VGGGVTTAVCTDGLRSTSAQHTDARVATTPLCINGPGANAATSTGGGQGATTVAPSCGGWRATAAARDGGGVAATAAGMTSGGDVVTVSASMNGCGSTVHNASLRGGGRPGESIPAVQSTAPRSRHLPSANRPRGATFVNYAVAARDPQSASFHYTDGWALVMILLRRHDSMHWVNFLFVVTLFEWIGEATLPWRGGRGAGKGVPPPPPQRQRPAGVVQRLRAGPSHRRAAHLRAADTAHGRADGIDHRATKRL